MNTALLARQPIYDKQLNVVAYELLFRPGEKNEAQIEENNIDGDHATSTVILNAFGDIGIDEVIGNHPAFINFTRNFLIDHLHNVLPHNKVVIEILEDVHVDSKLIDSVKNLKQQGYTIALDDFVMSDELDELVKLADIIKLDVLSDSPNEIENKVAALKDYNIKLLAEKIETHEIFEVCKKLGFDYFQGYFLSKPNIIKGKKIKSNRLVTLKLLADLQKPDVEIEEVESTLSRDPSLSYKLLRLINSAAYTSTRKIDSLREAIVRSGIDTIRNWAALIILTSSTDKPTELLYTTMIRAKMCQYIAEEMDIDESNMFFTAGLFSTLDALLDEDLNQIVTGLPLSDTVSSALLERQGQLGETLENIIAYERGDWESINFGSLDAKRYTDAYLQGIEWANKTCSAIIEGKK